ncbi:MAG: GDP-mannose 4,6-dehydratase [Acetobacteraceae bacterium]|nr:GDP-mannose 4,6-dehydratase [Acetobacteraceae bacterium]
MPNRILLTGARGFVARHLVPALQQAFPAAEVHDTHFDVTDAAAVQNAVRRASPDACIHLAGITTVAAAGTDPEQAWRVNVLGTLNLARAVLATAPECRFLFASSSEVYGASFKYGCKLDEAALLAPMNSYAATKAAADLALGAMAYEGLRVVRLRLFNHTGPGQSKAFVVPAFARQIARIEAALQHPPMRVGSLDTARDLLDVRDVCAAYIACLRAHELPPGIVLNVGSGVARRIGDILQELLCLARLNVEVVVATERLRSSEITSAAGDARKARDVLGWEPAIPWKQTLTDVLADWRFQVAG